MQNIDQKVRSVHLNRPAYLYVRQSTLKQVVENTESTLRQDDLRQKALALGWPADRIVVIDNDQAHSGTSMTHRKGFQRLVADVTLGEVGMVMGLEVSRLARNSADWHRLLEVCALADTLILDEDGIYDPNVFNDRTLLGLKGAFSEAETWFIRSRMREARISKAQRGKLKMSLPIGLAYSIDGRVILNPNIRVQESLRTVFATFRETGAAYATTKTLRERGISLPHLIRSGPQAGALLWVTPTRNMISISFTIHDMLGRTVMAGTNGNAFRAEDFTRRSFHTRIG